MKDSVQLCFFPEIDKRRISSTNSLERTNEEIKPRTWVVEVFLSFESYLKLVISYLIEYSEDLANEYACIKSDKLGQLLESKHTQVAN